MEIISQNYNKLLEELIINNFSTIMKGEITKKYKENKVFNYVNIVSGIDKKLCEIAKSTLTSLIESLDRGYRNSRERMHSYHIKSKYTRSILTIFGEITYRKTVYINKYTYKSFCFIDDYLGLKKYDYFDPYIKALIIEYAANNPSGKIIKFINDLIGNRLKLDVPINYISKQTIRNIILQSNLSKPELKQLKDKDTIYIMADEKYISTQNNNKENVMIKQLVVFDGRTHTTTRSKLNNKRIFSSFNNSNFIDECLDYLYYVYDLDKVKNIYVMGDGAKWIKSLVSSFHVNKDTCVTFCLDKFHFKQALHHICLNKELEDILTTYILNSNKKDFIKVCDLLINQYPYRIDTIVCKKEYILNNWKSIIKLYNNKLRCPMESQISHNLADLLSSRPKAYSIKTLKKILPLRILYKNNENVKLLFLNNFNKKDILTLNSEYLNYNITTNYFNNDSYIESITPQNYHPGFYPDQSILGIDFRIYK